jgi:hypothetical protein
LSAVRRQIELFIDGDLKHHTSTLEINTRIVRPRTKDNSSSIAVCVKPMHSNVFSSRSARLIEHIEMYRILGVSKAFYYVHSASDHAMNILNHYQQTRGQVEILDWRGLEGVNVRTHGLMAALNDCIMR